jgi:predicted nucleotidyltransferase
MSQPTEASQYLLKLAQKNAKAYAALPYTKAIMVTGSVAEGLSDVYSDIDMIVYYDKLPSEEEMLAASEKNGGTDRKPLGERTEDEYGEAYTVHGVQCQVGHSIIAAWDRDVATVLEGLDVTTVFQKALSGMLHAIPLYGELLIRQWQAKLAAYPEALAEAMVKHYMSFFPLWYLTDHIAARDATVWRYQILTEIAQNLLGVLSGLNHMYYSSFQFKRMHYFVAQMTKTPADFSARVDALFQANSIDAAFQAEALVQETVAFVEQHMPNIDTTAIRRSLGRRQQPWELKAD